MNDFIISFEKVFASRFVKEYYRNIDAHCGGTQIFWKTKFLAFPTHPATNAQK